MKIQQTIIRPALHLLILGTLSVAPCFGQTITHVPLYTFDGDAESDQSGVVSGAGDVNGDGFADVIVGAPGDDNNGPRSGSVRVLSGIDGSVLYTFEGDSADDFFGSSVSGAGDVNGDGFADVIIGAYGVDKIGFSSGIARVFSGADGSVLYTFEGDSSNGRFGGSVSGAGDVNNDGFFDVIVGARGDDNNGRWSGSAQVFSGFDGSVLYTFEGDSANNLFGSSVSGAGDVNGDGFADVVIGVVGENNNGVDSGSARVFSGVDGSVLYNFDGDFAGYHFGTSVSGAGDVNDDGFADLIVGAPNDHINGAYSGSARVLSGVDGSVLYTFGGNSVLDTFGGSVSAAGDVNDDGFADLIVGSSIENSRGSARVLSGVDGSVLYTFEGDSRNNRFGKVSGVGDTNGDGVDDFIVGAINGGANEGGYARLFVSQITVPVLGDCDQNGVVDFLDIGPFIAVLSAGGFQFEADCNEDDAVDFLDIGPFIAILSGN